MSRLSSTLVASVATVALAAFALPAFADDCCSTSRTSLVVADDPPAEATAEQLLEQLEQQRQQMPPFDAARREDEAYVQSYLEQRREWMAERARLAWEFATAHPSHLNAARLAAEALEMRMQAGESPEEIREEIAGMLKREDLGEELRGHLLLSDAQAMLLQPDGDPTDAVAQAREAEAAGASPERVASLLFRAAGTARDPELRKTLLEQLVKDYPDTRNAAFARGQLRQTEGVGKPFELEFQDVVTGETINVQNDLEGKVVVIDFWATWCGPCIAEMPKMKELYSQFKDQGVEFIGISLDAPVDQGGRDKLLSYVNDNDIQWPQYYQGKGWESEFSSSWGINGIPALFKGNLHSTQARGQLKKLIPELIAKRDGGEAQAASGEAAE